MLVSQNLRPRKHCISARNTANRVLGFITRSVNNRSAHLDYAAQFWSPYYRMDIVKLEAV